MKLYVLLASTVMVIVILGCSRTAAAKIDYKNKDVALTADNATSAEVTVLQMVARVDSTPTPLPAQKATVTFRPKSQPRRLNSSSRSVDSLRSTAEASADDDFPADDEGQGGGEKYGYAPEEGQDSQPQATQSYAPRSPQYSAGRQMVPVNSGGQIPAQPSQPIVIMPPATYPSPQQPSIVYLPGRTEYVPVPTTSYDPSYYNDARQMGPGLSRYFSGSNYNSSVYGYGGHGNGWYNYPSRYPGYDNGDDGGTVIIINGDDEQGRNNHRFGRRNGNYSSGGWNYPYYGNGGSSNYFSGGRSRYFSSGGSGYSTWGNNSTQRSYPSSSMSRVPRTISRTGSTMRNNHSLSSTRRTITPLRTSSSSRSSVSHSSSGLRGSRSPRGGGSSGRR